jgi:hypothetical protein
MPGIRSKGYKARTPDKRKPRVPSSLKVLEQKLFRQDALKLRISENRITRKNVIEAATVGVSIPEDRLPA